MWPEACPAAQGCAAPCPHPCPPCRERGPSARSWPRRALPGWMGSPCQLTPSPVLPRPPDCAGAGPPCARGPGRAHPSLTVVGPVVRVHVFLHLLLHLLFNGHFSCGETAALAGGTSRRRAGHHPAAEPGSPRLVTFPLGHCPRTSLTFSDFLNDFFWKDEVPLRVWERKNLRLVLTAKTAFFFVCFFF